MRMIAFVEVLGASLLGLGCPAWVADAPAPADLLLTDGAIYTVNPAQPWAQAVAVRGGKIVYVGADAGARKYRGAGTHVIDLKGRFAMPGIVDEHVHPVMGGIKVLYECVFPFTATPAEVAAAVKACVAKAPSGAWIRGGQWGSSFFTQNKLESPRGFLDAVSGDHPVYLYDDSGHNGWANSAALKAAGLGKASANPDGGTIVRDATGEPSGLLLEGGARLFDTVIPPWTDEQLAAAAREAARLANTYGITAIKDAGAPFAAAGNAFSSLDKKGELTLDVAICAPTPYGDRKTPLDYAEVDRQRDAYRSTHVHTEFVKLFLDGVPTEAANRRHVEPVHRGCRAR